MLNFAFEHGCHRIVAEVDARNAASARLAERLGMLKEAHFRQDLCSKGEWTDTFEYAKLSTDPR
ncbi:GNAT family N-acetyltransferase [Flaviflexus sp.]|uniref:GNAT family N-acetyltransferase n=1 Tax=Flaviflexus sp. TaxID=1969482 RepID=UPI00352C6988